MEDYVIIGSVLQAKHMSDFIKRPKHVRKYEIKSSTYTLPVSEYSLYRQPPRTSVKHNLQIQKSNNYVRKSQIFLTKVSDKKKTKTKAILEKNQKLSETCKDDWNKKHFDEFFIKKEIEPRTPRTPKQHVIKRAKLSRTPEVTQRVFYDADFSLVKSKSRECIILPEGRHTQRKVDLTSTQSSFTKINIQELIDNEWQVSRRKRKIQNKTSSLLAHEKTKLQKEARRIEEQLKNKENDEKFGGGVRTPFQKPKTKQYMIENFKKSQLPLGKDEVNMKTSFLMEKYRIDQSKICLKISNK